METQEINSRNPAIPLDTDYLSNYTSRIFVDLHSMDLSRRRKATQFFSGDSFSEIDQRKKIETLKNISFQREKIYAILTRQNQLYQASKATISNIEKVKSPNTFFIVTGQQVGLFSGSLYTIYKTITTIALSKFLTKKWRSNYPEISFIPLFWLEGEDHDYEEISKVTTFHQGKPETFQFQSSNFQKRKMTGRTVLGKDIELFIDTFIALLQPSDYKSKIESLLKETYTPEKTFTEAFATLMMKLFSEDGLVFLNSDDQEFKRLCAPVFSREIMNDTESSQQVIAQSALLEEEGFQAQAKSQPINAYLIEDSRRLRLERLNAKEFSLLPDKSKVSESNILDFIYNEPERFSANVILRPLIQDYAFPNAVYVGGPGEAGYWAQLKSLYSHFNIEEPLFYPRASLSLLENKYLKAFHTPSLLSEELGIFFSDKNKFIQTRLPEAGSAFDKALFEESEEKLRIILESLRHYFNTHQPAMIQHLNASAEKMIYHLKTLQEKSQKLELDKHQVALNQIEKAYTNLIPSNILQERVINFFFYANKYGFELLENMKFAVESNLEEPKHLVLTL
ncbi:MAG: bacillithiol biosynthesis cysteine-adding enzyme BshC [Chloroherpetonaceae bacterium]|nr:bacillithiol biosynthesis cysteine-adding enzyme BshC [Chloroherpetonaceae bacterium]